MQHYNQCSNVFFSFLPSKQIDSTYNFNNVTKQQYIIKEELLYCYSKDDFSNKKHKCEECNFKTSHFNSLKRHLNHHRSKKDTETFECYQCGFKTTVKFKLISHMQWHQKEKKFIYLSDRKRPYGFYPNHCPDCDYQTNDKSNMRRHLMKHGRLIERCFNCFHCDYHTSRKDALIIHISRKHRPKIEKVKGKLECNECGLEANSKTNLEIHKSTHKDVKHMKVHECTECSYKTIYKNGLTRHIASHRALEENMFSCYLCNYKAVRKDELKNHIGRHNKSNIK